MARVALGSSEGGNFPSAIKAVALWFPRRERALATALFNSGANVGAVIAPGGRSGSRSRSLGVARGIRDRRLLRARLAGALAAVSTTIPGEATARLPVELSYLAADSADEQAGRRAARRSAGWRSSGYRQAWSFIVGKFLTDPVWWFFLIWLPDFFKKTRGLDIKGSRISPGRIYSIVTVLSVAGGWLAGRCVRGAAYADARRKTTMLICALAVLPIVAVTRAGDWSAVVLIGVAGSAHQAWSANLFTTVSDMFPKRAVASLVGIGGMAGSIGGIVFPISSAGSSTASRRPATSPPATRSCSSMCGLAYVVAFAVGQLWRRASSPSS